MTIDNPPIVVKGTSRPTSVADESASAEFASLGGRIRLLRVERAITLDSLSERTGFSKGYLSRIENNRKTPPLGTLARIAEALDTPLTELLSPADRSSADGRPFVSLVRANERREVTRGATAFGYDYVSLVDAATARHMQPLLFTFPADIDKHVFFEHKGEEFMFILSGRVQWQVGHEVHLLEPGDSLYFDARLPHRGRSLEGEATALVVLYSPEHQQG